MKWLIIAGVVLLLLVAGALLPNKSVKAELTIDAPVHEVWSVIMDGASYVEWNPILVDVQGDFAEGATMHVSMKTSDGGVTPVTPVVKKLIVNQELNQFGGMRGVLTYDHHWYLEQTDAGTKVTQFEEYRGIGVLFWDPGWVQDAYMQGLIALQKRLESKQ